MDDKTKQDIKAVFDILNQIEYPKAQEGDYVEMDDNNVVHIKRADGTPIMMMSLMDYVDLIDNAISEPFENKMKEMYPEWGTKHADHIIFPDFTLKEDKE